MSVITISNENALEALAAQLKAFFAALVSGVILPEQAKLSLSFVLSDFAENSSALTSGQEDILDQLYLLLNSPSDISGNQLIRLVYEIDELIGRASQTGAEANNVALSRERAEAVRDWLSDNGLYALPAVIYHGSADPLVDADRDELAINRSVEIRILVSLDVEPLEKELDHWGPVFLHEVPGEIETSLDERGIEVQSLDTADAIMMDPKLNLDYYQVRITEMPKKPDGSDYPIAALFREIRLNLSDIISAYRSRENPFRPGFMRYDNESVDFGDTPGFLLSMLVGTGAHAGFGPYSADDESLWLSSDPTGAVMRFDSFGDDMGVVCSAFGPDFWIFTTVGDSPLPGLGSLGSHPVSGNRKFGYLQDSSGRFLVYTQGVDRTTGTFETGLGPLVFGGGHIIWLAWQVGVYHFVTERGGKAEILKPMSNRSSYEEALEHFSHNPGQITG